MKAASRYKNTLFITLVLFLVAVVVVSPWGNHSVNDDWDFYTSTRFFSNGELTKGPQTDTSFVLQGVLGAVWGQVFGLSYASLRALTLALAILSLFGVYAILKRFSVNRQITLLTLLTVAFNPIFFTSSLSYMTEIYFFVFVIWSVYFFDRSISNKKSLDFKSALVSAVLASGNILVRQYGIALFAAYFVIMAILYFKGKQISKSLLVAWLGPLVVALLTLHFWPAIPDANSKTLFSADPLAINNMLRQAPFLLVYIGFFASPLIFLFAKLLDKKPLIGAILGALILTPFIYLKDIFPLGNVFYIEKLYGKSNFIHELSLFDNIPFKIALSAGISFALVLLVILVAKWIAAKNFSLHIRKLSLIIITLSMYAVVFLGVFIAGDFYDRYFINGFLLTIILLGILANNVKTPTFKPGLFAFVTLFSITLLLSIDFYSSEEIKWNMGRKLQQEKGLYSSVFVNGTFTRFMHYNQFESAKDVSEPSFGGLAYECFVQSYTKEVAPNALHKILHRFENSRTLNRHITNPVIFESEPTAGIELLEWHWDDIEYEQTYFSPIYSLLGVEPVIATYCRS